MLSPTSVRMINPSGDGPEDAARTPQNDPKNATHTTILSPTNVSENLHGLKPKLELNLKPLELPAVKLKTNATVEQPSSALFPQRHRSLAGSDNKPWNPKPFPDTYFNSVRAIVADNNKQEPSPRRNLMLDKINPAHQSYREVEKFNRLQQSL